MNSNFDSNKNDFIKSYTRRVLAIKAIKSINQLIIQFNNEERKNKNAFILFVFIILIFMSCIAGLSAYNYCTEFSGDLVEKYTTTINRSLYSKMCNGESGTYFIEAVINDKTITFISKCSNAHYVNEVIKVGYYKHLYYMGPLAYKILYERCLIRP